MSDPDNDLMDMSHAGWLLGHAGIPDDDSLAVRVGLLIDERDSLKDELEQTRHQAAGCEMWRQHAQALAGDLALVRETLNRVRSDQRHRESPDCDGA